MRRPLAALLLLATELTTPAPIHAYLKFGFRIGAETVDVKWASAPVRYFVNERDIAGVRATDFEAQGEGLSHYAQVLQRKPYAYGTHWAPHDIAVKELGSGRSRWETAANLGLHFAMVPNVPLEDGIHAARMLFPRCWFDETKTAVGVETLLHYRRDYNPRIQEFIARPVHDWASHGADAFRYLAVHQRTRRARDMERETARDVARAQRDMDPYDRYKQRALAGQRRRGGL